MKNLKNIFCVIILFFAFSLNAVAQEKKDLDKMPKPIGGIEALMKNIVYPEDAKKNNIEGKVFVTAVVNEKGDVVKASITKTDNDVFNEASIKAVKATKFTPGEKGGKKVKAEVVVPIMYKLH